MVRSLSSGVIAASSLAAALVLGASVAQAGGGCRGSACYNLVNTPPVYGSINETYRSVRPRFSAASSRPNTRRSPTT